jgi:hypothetical protein
VTTRQSQESGTWEAFVGQFRWLLGRADPRRFAFTARAPIHSCRELASQSGAREPLHRGIGGVVGKRGKAHGPSGVDRLTLTV